MRLYARVLLLLATVLAASGCLVDRSPIGGAEGGRDAGRDAAAILEDAAGLDAPGLDAPRPDARSTEEIDAFAPTDPDAWSAPTPDAWVAPPPDARPSCMPTPEVCNARDDDCNGVVDEAGCAASIGVFSVSCAGFTRAGHVYQFCKSSPIALAWEAALMACRMFPPYDLVRIDDLAENAVIDGTIDEDAWIGLNDRTVEGLFTWADATPPLFVSWAGGEPTSERGASGAGEDCASFRGSGPIWEDRYCGIIDFAPGTPVRAFVCEATILP